MADRLLADGRLGGAGGDGGATIRGRQLDTQLTRDKAKMRRVQEDNEARLRELAESEQRSRSGRDKFRERNGLELPPSEGGWAAWLVLVGVFALETLINGLFFADHLPGSWIDGIKEAVLISLFNLSVVALVGCLMIGQINLASPLRRTLGWVGLVVVVAVAIAFNLAVAHYRDALPRDQPGWRQAAGAGAPGADPLDVGTNVAGGAARSPGRVADPQPEARIPAECQRTRIIAGEAELDNDPDREAICMLRAHGFNLGSFKSYLLMFIGIAMCAIATWDLRFGIQDPCPGYRERQGDLKRRCDELDDAHGKAMAEVDGIFHRARATHDRSIADGDPAAPARLSQLEREYDRVSGLIREVSGR